MTLYILQGASSAVAYSKWPFHYLSFTLLPHFYYIFFYVIFLQKQNKIDQQFHDTLYFCKVLNAISEVEFLLLHIVGMQKSKYTTGYLTIQDNNQKCRSKRILRSNFPYLMHFRKGEKAAVVQPKVIMNTTSSQLLSKPSLKIRTASAIFGSILGPVLDCRRNFHLRPQPKPQVLISNHSN